MIRDAITAIVADRWVIFGLFGQALFSMRFLVQWIASELKKQSVIPTAFWVFSLAGAATLLMHQFSSVQKLTSTHR